MARKKRRPTEHAPGWVWMLFGLSVGLVVALVVYLKSGAPEHVTARAGTAATINATATQPQARAQSQPTDSTGTVAANAPAEPASSAAGTTSDDNQFTFFTDLAESEVVVPASDFEARALAPENQEYTIQAGSFLAHEDADRLQARLALLGIESAIERTIVGNKIYFRVIIGPLSDRGEINRTVRRLNAERIESLPPRPVSN
jgi:cell division protein FtsN